MVEWHCRRPKTTITSIAGDNKREGSERPKDVALKTGQTGTPKRPKGAFRIFHVLLDKRGESDRFRNVKRNSVVMSMPKFGEIRLIQVSLTYFSLSSPLFHTGMVNYTRL